jgi:transposase
MSLNSKQLLEVAHLYEVEGLSTRQIAERLGVSKNVILGYVYREGYVKAGYEPTTTMQRLDTIHARMDEVLRITR